MSKDLQRTLGVAARGARKTLGFTQEQVAERLGVSVEFYGRIERSVAWPSIQVFARMVLVLNVSADALIGIDVAHAPEPVPLTRPDDPPELCELVVMLRRARPGVVELASKLVREFERALGTSTRSHDQGNKSQ